MSDRRVVLGVNSNQGYGAYQIDDPMTLGDLANLVAEAINQYGQDTLVVVDNGQQFGARFGSIDRYSSIEPAEFRPGDDDE